MQQINPKSPYNSIEARGPTMAGDRFSIKLFIIAFVFTGAVLAWLSWSTYDLYTHDAIIKGQVWRVEELQGIIIHLDEVLTMSARMAAATGDPQWEARYRRFEPQLDKAIKEILKLAPSQTLAQTDAANMKLVELENHAFTLVRENHTEEARAILFSQEYETQKGIYASGMTGFLEHLQVQLEARQRSGRNRAVFSAGAGIIVLAILLFSWLAIIRRMYKAHAVLLTSITRRKQKEEALHESEKGFRQLADAMPQIVWTARPDGGLDYYNQRWFDYTGMTLEETEGWGWAPVLHTDDLQNCIDIWSEAVRTGSPYEIKYRFKRASDGVYRWHLGRASAVRDSEGRIVKWFGTCTDIDDQKRTEEALELARNELETRVRERTAELVTVNVGLQKQMAERQRAEEASRESEGRYRELVDNGQGLICSHDLNGKLLSVNPAAARALGYAPSEMVGKGLIEFISPTVQPVFDHYLKLVAAQPNVNGLMNLITKEGEERIWTYRNARIEGQGKAVYILGHAQDITEQKRTEEALRQQRDFTTAITGSIAEGVYALDRDGMVTFMNPAAEQMLGWKQAELPDQNMHDIIHFQSADGTRVPAGECPLLAVLRSGKILRVEDDVFTRRGGVMLPVSYTSSPIISNGRVLGAVLTFHDITVRKRAEAERRAIAEIVHGVLTTSNLDELFTLAHHAISRLLPAENCFVALYDKTSDLLNIPFCKDEFDPVAAPQKLGKGLTAFVLRSGRPMSLTPELIKELVSKGEIELVGTLPAAWLGVPLRTSNDIIGVLVVQHYEDKDAYSQQDLELLASVADQLGLAIERKQIEIKLRTNEIQLNEAQHIAHLGSWEWDVLTDKVRWSDELFGIFGLQPQESGATFDTFLTFVHPDDRKIAESAIAQAFQDRVYPQYEYRITRPDGTIRVLQANGRVTDDETGRTIKMVGTVLDITERKQLENTLRQERIFLRTLIDNIPDSVYVKDMGCRKVIANLAEVRISGLQSEAEVLGKDDFAMHPKELAENFFADDQVVLQTGQPVVNREEYVLSKQGQKSWLLTTKIPLRDENGQIVGLLGLGRDITERKQADLDLIAARDAALESTRLKSEFLANMSHEIRTPMNGVIGMTGLLLDTELSAEQQEFAETIRSSGDALLTIINDILDFSKIEAGKLQFETLDFDLDNAVEGAVELLAERARDKKIELASLIYSDVTTKLQGDPGRLRQVLTNLLGNAVKFTEQGEVIVRAEKESETDNDIVIRFTVSDTGIGIDEPAQQRLFQAFTQADGSTTRKYGGTGLGLAISKQLVELMGGEIGVTSEPGKGSTFWFTARLAKQSGQPAAPQPSLPSLNQLRVLIVDDNATNRKILSHQLGSWGMIHQESDSGARALEMLCSAAARGEPYDLAIIDLMVPGMDGFELARSIKSEPLIAATRLVMLTSHGLRGDSTTAREAGVAAYLTKPIRQSQLFDCLTNVVSQPSVETGKEPAPLEKPAQLITRHVLKETTTITNKLILLAEDNIVNQKVAVRQLQKLGYRADAVANGREAVEALKRIPYDVVLMDCQMPEMDGYEATAEIRRLEGQTKHTIIVAMTANSLQGDREKCIEAGMDDYISKPVKPEDLAQVLQRVFAGSSSDKEAASCVPEEVLPPVDMARLHEAMGDELFEILDIYLVQMSENLEKLMAAIAAGNASEVDLIAHNCAGTSANCGMVAVVQPLRELERMGREGCLDGAKALGRQVFSEFERVKVFLKDNLAPVAV